MKLDELPLARQVDYVFRELETELTDAVAGTVLIHIRNNAVGKYGVRHNPIETRDGEIGTPGKGLSASQVSAFRRMAVDALKYKREWSHGEILYDFTVRPGAGEKWSASIQYESNYNTVNWAARFQQRSHPLRDYR